MNKKPKQVGNVYWTNSQKIDKSDTKIRRLYVVVKDNGKNVGVSKVRGFNNNPKSNDRLYELNKDKYNLSKRSGVDNKIYSRRVDNNKLLKLNDHEVFDKKAYFKFSSHDTHRVLKHVKTQWSNKNKKGRK